MISWLTLMTGLLTLMAYPATHSGVIFNHEAHFVQRDIGCVDCHTGIPNSVSTNEKDIPGHDICSECHAVDTAPDDCRLCHSDPNNPVGVTLPDRGLIFSHKKHLKSDVTSQNCLDCHKGVDKAVHILTDANYPTMNRCFKCHNGIEVSAECKVCHVDPEMAIHEIHPPDWEHSHRFQADAKESSCQPCHQKESFCSDCHAGVDYTENVHNLNYRFTHGLDAKGKEFECQSCHDFETFCNDCHNQSGEVPFNHFLPSWNPRTNPQTHADNARRDIESCASCHQEENFTCSQPGSCHFDGDGIRGSNPSIHNSSITEIGHGPWHDDPGFQCYQCHISTNRPGAGFCGYCHGSEVD